MAGFGGSVSRCRGETSSIEIGFPGSRGAVTVAFAALLAWIDARCIVIPAGQARPQPPGYPGLSICYKTRRHYLAEMRVLFP
jgi:hypothetical protein